MIKAIVATNHLGESIRLELGHPEKSGFLVQGIDGLGPCKATINSTEMATTDGSLYNSARTSFRNIVLRLKYLWKPTIEDVRQLSYKYFPVKKQIKLLIETDNRISEIYGYVEENSPSIFSKSEGTQISIICPDPHFYSVEKEVVVFSGIESKFEFEFSNESLTENLIEFGRINNESSQNIYYSGDSEVGIVIFIHALGPVENLTIYNSDTREKIKIDTDRLVALTGNTIDSGDDIVLSTVKGNKYIALLRGGTYINILNCLDKDANWFQLSKGNNVFIYTAESGESNLEFRVEYQTVYEGI